MERSATKRAFPDLHNYEHDDHPSQANPKRTCSYSIPTLGSEAESDFVAKILSPQSWPRLEAFLRRVVTEEFDSKFKSYFHFLPPSSPRLISNNIQLNTDDQNEETTKFELRFLNQIASTIFTNNEIEAENCEVLQVALIDLNNLNAIVSMGPLSMAQIEVVVLNGDPTEFITQSILSERVGKRPLIVGNDLKLHLKNGVGFIKSLSFTDNSSWSRSKQFRLGIRIVDDNVLAKFPRIKEAISQPFRVLDRRGEVNKKHHPPHREDEVWRLEGIRRNGVHHKNLSSQGIETVDDFLRTYDQKGPLYLKKLLGKNVPKKMWNAMISNALECPLPDNFAPSFEMQNLFGYEAMGSVDFDGNLEVTKQRNSSDRFVLDHLHNEW